MKEGKREANRLKSTTGDRVRKRNEQREKFKEKERLEQKKMKQKNNAGEGKPRQENQ